MKTYETSTERLRAVADLIESTPGRHNQGVWMDFAAWGMEHFGYEVPDLTLEELWDEFHSEESQCGTKGCIAGWGVMFTPIDHPALEPFAEADVTYEGEIEPENADAPSRFWSWHSIGAEVLGLHESVAEIIFSAIFAVPDFPALLRRLASLPEGKRTRWNYILNFNEDLNGYELPKLQLKYGVESVEEYARFRAEAFAEVWGGSVVDEFEKDLERVQKSREPIVPVE